MLLQRQAAGFGVHKASGAVQPLPGALCVSSYAHSSTGTSSRSSISTSTCATRQWNGLAQHVQLPAARWQATTLPSVSAAVAAAAATASPATLPASKDKDVAKYRFKTQYGATVLVATQTRGKDTVVTITIPGNHLPAGVTPTLHWGMFRSSASTWYHPEAVRPPGSQLHSRSGAMRTPFSRKSESEPWQLEFVVPARMAPLQLAFNLYWPELDLLEGARATRAHMTVPIGMGVGEPAPLGPSLTSVVPAANGSAKDAVCTLNFAVFSRSAAAMSLCLMRRDGGGYLEVALDPTTNRTGDVWHCSLPGLRDVGSLVYGWRADGAVSWAEGGRFHPAYIMLDPYCPRALRMMLPQAAYDAAPMLPPQGELHRPVVLGSLSYLTEHFDWGDDARPCRPLEDTVLLELSIPAFTTGPDAQHQVHPQNAGSYLGVIDRLEDITATGANAIVLGSALFGSDTGRGAFGRSPLSFMAPETGFVAGGGEDPAEAARQLKELVKAAHARGIEVYMEVEFCITAESVSDSSKLQSLKGLDGDMYYRGGAGPEGGSVLNAGQSVVRALIVTALRRWAHEYHIDGFVVTNAENLAQDVFGTVLDAPPPAEELARDPLLSDIKLVAAPSDERLLPRGGERGFPHHGIWLEWSRRFIDQVVPLLRDNAGGLLGAFATRIAGSPDLTASQYGAGYPTGLAAGRRPAMAINSISLPGGSGALELGGGEGVSAEDAMTVARSLLLAVLVAEGTPAFNAATTQHPDLQRFISTCLTIRRKYQALLAPAVSTPKRTVTWHGSSSGSQPDWAGYGSNYIAFSVVLAGDKAAPPVAAPVAAPGQVPKARAQALYVGFNPHFEAAALQLPAPPAGLLWRRLVDTSRVPPADALLEGGEDLHNEYVLNPRAALMLEAVPIKVVKKVVPKKAAAAGSRAPGGQA